MAHFYREPSRTFSEYLLVPNLTTKTSIPGNVSLKTPIARYMKGEKCPFEITIPVASAIMQSVSDSNMAIALARSGGISFIYASQPIEQQAEMVIKVKNYKAGFVVSDSNLKPDQTLKDVLDLKARTGHSTIAITEDGSSTGKLLGVVTSRDYRLSRSPLDRKIQEFMTPFSSLIYGKEGITLSEANDMIWDHKLNCLPIINKNQNIMYLVFRKDYDDHKENPDELLDQNKRLRVGAGINTRDFTERVPALVKAGVDVLCIDSSDGFSEWQRETVQWIKQEYNGTVKVGAGNVVDKEGFLYLAESGADFVKVGIGGGSICITREQKGIGRGQATSVIEVAQARDEYFKQTGIYVPICSDGGIVHDYHITLALAMGADFVMLGRYFARFDESPTRKLKVGANFVKEYWGEGSNRARNWERYDAGGEQKLEFEEGVDSYVPYAGKLKDNLDITISKIKSTLCNCGAVTIEELQKVARITFVSSTSIIEGGAHDVILKESHSLLK
ncbi:IMP dehydrogenase [Desulfosporosinus nitroreducens]|uniref:IMP dehydrogenase n=1 Tax=Desulfosporosinus nitroreducens TaxID=2018668 RepID=A0ABT8QMA7_9FIRM|nr:IMP dehydrogenase [Desulfosporosinus nitroreducens]MDO0822477.1 IMP dehydrogenase [Desulfosporosinus nitroreducens]